MRTLTLLVVLPWAGLAACAEGSGPPAPDVVAPGVRPLIEAIVGGTLNDGFWVANFSRNPGNSELFRERGFALSLPGVSWTSAGMVTLAREADTQPAFDPYCAPYEPGDDVFWQTRTGCLLLGRSPAGEPLSALTLVTVYFTVRPHTDPADRHPFEYASESDSGATITFELNPLVQWRIEIRDPDSAVVTAQLDRRMRLSPPGSEPFDLSHQGVIHASHYPPTDTSDSLRLEFPSLSPAGLVVVEVTIDREGQVTGAVSVAGATLATIDGPCMAPQFKWIGP